MSNPHVVPFLKWAGGKRQLLPKIRERLPETYNRYYEPFIGGGAVLFDLVPDDAVINDANRALTNVYRQIAERPLGFLERLNELDALMERAAEIDSSKAFYLQARNLYNRLLADGEYGLELAALFVFLNKHCFNGLYRENSKGEFNVPYNNKVQKSCDEDSILETSYYLQRVAIRTGDFADACTDAGAGDFVFLDSPYVPLNENTFISYTKDGFGPEEHQRVAELFRELDGRGCYVMATNHNAPIIRELYEGYRIEAVDVKRAIKASGEGRTGEEVIIRNY